MDTNSMFEKIEAVVGADRALHDEPMAAHTTFRVGGPADLFVMPADAEGVGAVLALCREAGVDAYVMGRGSNVLVADAGLRGVVVQIANNMSRIDVSGTRVVAAAGATNAKVAAVACRAGLAGYEFAAGIPGTIGGAALMNAGAYGGEFKDVAVSLTCLAPDGELVDVSREQAHWGYRHSMMKDAGYVVIAATLELETGDPADIQARMDELARKRAEKQPLDLPSAGSTFKRPEGHFAGKLIQDAGLQGFTVGGAQVSNKHAGFVVNVGHASADDVRRVIEHVRAVVSERFGVVLEPEVCLWGF